MSLIFDSHHEPARGLYVATKSAQINYGGEQTKTAATPQREDNNNREFNNENNMTKAPPVEPERVVNRDIRLHLVLQ